MKRALIVAFLLLASAAPAQAQMSGPAIDGERVLVGVEDSGNAVLVERSRGRERTLWRSKGAADPGDGTSAVAASSGWTAYATYSFRKRRDEVVASYRGGPFSEVVRGASGPIAAEGDGLVLVRRRSVLLLEGGERRRLARVERSGSIRDVDITRRHVAWTDDEGITIARRSDGDVVRRIRPDGGVVFEFDLDDNGDVVACMAFPRVSRVFTFSGGKSRRVGFTRTSVAIAGGRIAYFTKRRLVVESLSGKRLQAFGRFPASDLGYVDLSADRVAWLLDDLEVRRLRG